MKRTFLPLLLTFLPAFTYAQQTTVPNTSSSAVERDLRTFSSWVNEKMDRAEAGARREWPRLMADFDRQSQRLDRGVDSLSVQSKREYATQKARYKAWATEQQRLDAQAQQPETAQQAQDRLLNEKVTLSRARAAELPDLYGRFIDATRAQRRQWTDAEWSQASAVLSRLNARYAQVRTEIPMEDRLRIRSWQGEFRTFEKARDVKAAVDK